jgi:hypothetical protein
VRCAALAALVAAPAGALAQRPQARSGPGIVRGIVQGEDGQPIPYAVVALLPGLGQRFTDDAGAFGFTLVAPGTYRVLARQVGFRPKDTTVVVAPNATTVVRLSLEHLTVQLAEIKVVASRGCTAPGPPDSLVSPDLAAIFDQLKLNAERYRLLVSSYPFRFRMERVFVNYAENGEVVDSLTDTVSYRSNAGPGYRPGQVVGFGRGRGNEVGLVLNLPTLADFADSSFQANHCFAYAGMVEDEDTSAVRFQYEPTVLLRTPDIEGYVDLDPVTFQVRRALVRLTHPVRALQGLSEASSTIYFAEIYPNVVVQRRIVSVSLPVLRLDVKNRIARYTQTQRMLEVRFLTPLPGNPPPPKRY